jgi:hypothetical protein
MGGSLPFYSASAREANENRAGITLTTDEGGDEANAPPPLF